MITARLRALVVEDEWAARDYLVELLEKSGSVDVIGAAASAEAARDVLGSRERDIDVAFVDVRLVGGESENEGLDLVRSFARTPGAPMFVLATAFAQHALEAFDLGIVDYLLKPFTVERVAQCLERVHARRPPAPPDSIAAPGPSRIVVRRKRALVFLRLDEVWAFEAAERLAFVHTSRGTFDVDLSLSAVEASFGRKLLRVHRNWLINAEHVRELEGAGSETEILVGDQRVPVARERAQAVREALMSNAMGIRVR
jgi:two-component system, LytTR family, response regulator LytT